MKRGNFAVSINVKFKEDFFLCYIVKKLPLRPITCTFSKTLCIENGCSVRRAREKSVEDTLNVGRLTY